MDTFLADLVSPYSNSCYFISGLVSPPQTQTDSAVVLDIEIGYFLVYVDSDSHILPSAAVLKAILYQLRLGDLI